MIELNIWFFVLLANFLFLIFILNIILFQPLLKLFRERETIVKDSLEGAQSLTNKKDEALSVLQNELSRASEEAKELFKKLRQEGLDTQKEHMNKVQDEVMKKMEKAREEISDEVLRAKETLRVEIDNYTANIVKKLIPL